MSTDADEGSVLERSVAEVLRTDHHTHTDFSDGRDRLDAVVAAASAAGLTTLVLTDHVRQDSDYLPRYRQAVRAAAAGSGLRLVCGVETKIMDTRGRLDLPDDLDGIEHIAVADHRFPLPDGPAHPDAVRALLAEGRLTAAAAVEYLVEATANAVTAIPGGRTGHLAHLFSVLPKVGLDETQVGPELLGRLARACRDTGTAVEINEKWRCPSPATARVLNLAGVTLVAGSDAHTADAVGAWDYAAATLRGLPRAPRGSQASP